MPPLHERCSEDTLAEFRAAARERYQDGCVLFDGGRRTAAVYLWGYAAEMTVKAAYFAIWSYERHEPFRLVDLKAALGLATGLGVKQFGLHDIVGWGQLLVRTRAVLSHPPPYPPALATEVLNHTRHIYRVWRETLRYHKNAAYRYEADRVRVSTRWLLDRSSVL